MSKLEHHDVWDLKKGDIVHAIHDLKRAGIKVTSEEIKNSIVELLKEHDVEVSEDLTELDYIKEELGEVLNDKPRTRKKK
jgi:hypothetical protein